jgi:hypothetical protein
VWGVLRAQTLTLLRFFSEHYGEKVRASERDAPLLSLSLSQFCVCKNQNGVAGQTWRSLQEVQ